MLTTRHPALILLICLGGAASLAGSIEAASAQAVTPPLPGPAAADAGLLTLTIFLKHDESQTLDEINDRLRRQHFYDTFPPQGVEVLAWNVLMGVGQVVTLPGGAPARGQPRDREDRLGRLPHRVLSHLRLSPDGFQGARGTAVGVQVMPARDPPLARFGRSPRRRPTDGLAFVADL